MRFKNDNDNRYRVNFMVATEELMDRLTVAEFITYLQENGSFEDEDTMYLDKKCVSVKVYELKEENSNLRKEFSVTEDGRVFYYRTLLDKIELVDRDEDILGTPDLRNVKATVKETVAQINKEDDNWNWRAEVLKNEIRVWWGYLQYCDKEDSHFTIRMGTVDEGNTSGDFITARNERDEFITGCILGNEFYCDGGLIHCVNKLLRAIESVAHRCY